LSAVESGTTFSVQGSAAIGSGGAHTFVVRGGAHLGNASSGVTDIDFDLSRTVQFAGGALIADSKSFTMEAPTFTSIAAQTITNAATMYIDKAPVAGSNVTI